MIIDPITQAAIAMQNRLKAAIPVAASTVIPLSCGHRTVNGFVMWVSQGTAAFDIAATGTITNDNIQPVAGDSVTIGTLTDPTQHIYMFGTGSALNTTYVAIGGTALISMQNLADAINAVDPNVTASVPVAAALIPVLVSTNAANLSWNTTELPATLTSDGTLVAAGAFNVVKIGINTYQAGISFIVTGTVAAMLASIATSINAQDRTVYAVAHATTIDVTSEAGPSSIIITVTAKVVGDVGNSIVMSSTLPVVTGFIGALAG
jgi:hypothetical protein